MRVILEKGDKPEVKELVRQLQKLVPGIVIIEDETQQEHWLLSDDEIKEAILSVMPFFSVKSQWVAIYRILVDYYGFPEEVAAFCSRISKMMRGTEVYFTIDYQSVQKPLAANRILQKPYIQWKVFCAKKGDRVFSRQKMIASRMEIAEFNDDKADRTLLKRVPYYGIGISLPFILMRHWEEWQEHKTLTMDERDRRLCRLAMEIQYKCQQFYFGEMAYNYFADQNKELVQRRRTTRYDECFRKLPEEFKTQQFMEVFGCSQQAASRAIIRFQEDGMVEKVKYGIYRKVVSELP